MNLYAWIAIAFTVVLVAVTLPGLAAADRIRRRQTAARLPRIELVRGDITTEQVGAIVNAAKTSLMGGGGVDGAIHAAGGPQILRECRALRATDYPSGLPVGQAIETTAGDMPAMWVIHTVGPRYSPTEDRSWQLRACYINSLKVADALGVQSIAFPLISAGVYGWPRQDAIHQALTALRAARTNVKVIRLVFFDAETLLLAHVVRDWHRQEGYNPT